MQNARMHSAMTFSSFRLQTVVACSFEIQERVRLQSCMFRNVSGCKAACLLHFTGRHGTGRDPPLSSS